MAIVSNENHVTALSHSTERVVHVARVARSGEQRRWLLRV